MPSRISCLRRSRRSARRTRTLVDRLRAGRQAALQDGEREADGVAALAVQLLGAVHPLADVVRDLLVEVLLQRGELVGDGLGDPLREQRLALEGEQVLLDHAAHDAGGVGGVDSFGTCPRTGRGPAG